MVVENSTLHFLPRSLQLNMKMKMNSSDMPSKSSKEEPVPCHSEQSQCKDHKKRKRDIHAAIEEDSTSIKHAKTEKNKKKKKNKDVVVLQVPNGHPVGSFELEDIIAEFLSSRGLHSTLSVFLSETQHEYTKTVHSVQLEDIYHHHLKRIYKNPKEQKAEDVKFTEDTNFGKSVDIEFNKEDAKSEKTKGRFRKDDDAEVVPPIISSSRSEEGAVEKDHHRSDKDFSKEAMNDFSGAQKRKTKRAEKNSDMVTGTCKSKIKLLKASVESEQVSQFDEPVFESQKHMGEKKKVTLDERLLTDNEEQISRKKSKKVKITPKKKLQSTESHTLHGISAKVNIALLSNDSDSLLDIAVSKKKKKMKLHAMRPRDDEELTFGKKNKKEKMTVGNSLSMESHAINIGSNERRLQDLCKDTRKSPDLEAQEEEENKSTEMTLKDHSKISIHKKSKKKKSHCKKLQPECPNPVNGAKEIREYLFEDCDSTQNISQAHMGIKANKSITSVSVVSQNDSTVLVYKSGGAPVEQGGCKDTKAKVSLNLKDDQRESNTPKTAKSFQRVKVEEVKFSDPRFQDNSYWGKDGAENGYGAKAQEVLGHVKGKDFRHEKTKKKRGSYTGGMTDLQSYSTKFSYSDDE